ncbi:type IV pilus assembly protein PilB [Thermotomaculum hydrothermale]|uniref:Type IV pilus assembly protein PilB n=1 Tax=Thermotomaculum hydrothermale TaxID=981385 RepID=A0A7R6PXT1_9BACT|nr:GspE/PulE family protein [Thermotomaculum hydrothermale]BBB32735.1 type IV pilus assembly protein PilB [Thermotomaculum hydrothermale]
MAKERKKIGQILIEAGLITQKQLEEALTYSKKHNLRLGEALIQLNFVSEEDILKAISQQLNIPYLEVGNMLFDPEVVGILPENFCKRNKVIPLFLVDDTLTVAVADPLNIYLIDDIASMTGKKVNVVVSSEREIEQALEHLYAKTELEVLNQEVEGAESDLLDKPVIKLVNNILMQASQKEASDIHIEPGKARLRVRYRIDGVLREQDFNIPSSLASAVISRIKILSNMDIAEKRTPQDGRIQLKLGTKDYDIRVSTLPTIYGEKIVMRLLDKSSASVDLHSLGLNKQHLEIIKKLLKQPNGIILVTGPTGSGKTTTLYSCLKELNSEDKNIITVEDPVEYQFDNINQVQVNPQAGITFANGLRAILRQDPDIIMVGEIRDRETAEIAVQAALTGHLVLSTIHTNDASSTISRLVEMEIEPFLLASSIRAIIGQRLVRKICPNCQTKYNARDDEKIVLGYPLDKPLVLKKGKGCSFCSNTGYKGRTGIYEILVINSEIRKMIVEKKTPDEIIQKAKLSGYKTMQQDGFQKVLDGITTLEEVLRVTRITE